MTFSSGADGTASMTDSEGGTSAALTSLLVRDDPDLRDLVADFVGGLDQRLDEIRRAAADLDWENLVTLAHRLKGAGGSYGYPAISAVATEMERSFRERSLGDCARWIEQLERLVCAARTGLAADPPADARHNAPS